MPDEPDGAALLRQARETLLEELLPALPEDERLNALMIANAIAIGARELDAAAVEQAPGDPRLAAAIRRGDRDGDAALHETLVRSCVARLKLSSPKALD